MTQQDTDPAARRIGGLQADTPILTRRGERRAIELEPGDKVQTFSHGPQEVLGTAHWVVTPKTLLSDPDTRPLRLVSPAIMIDTTALFGRDHRLLLPDMSLFGAPELVDTTQMQTLGHARTDLPRGGVRYVHLLMERHTLIMAGGLWCETLCLDQSGHTSLRHASVTLAPRHEIGDFWHSGPCLPSMSDAAVALRMTPPEPPRALSTAQLVRIA